MTLPSEVISNLKRTVDAACADPKTSIPGTSVVVVGKDGKELFAHATGKRGVTSSEEMTLDTVFWIASCTKMIAGLACMQLVEQGKLHLDDGEETEKLLPELRDLKVLQKDGSLVEKKGKITLRMLLTHTALGIAGFGYTFFNESLRDYSHPIGFDEFSGHIKDICQPLTFQPGEGWQYGVGIDFAGLALERVTNLSLNDYCHKNIFEPLGLKNISMFPNDGMKKRLANMNQRTHDGKLIGRDHLLRKPLFVESNEVKDVLNSGGAGAFSTPSDYAQIIATLLNDGTSPVTNVQIIKKETVNQMFTNQIPRFPDFGRQGIAAAKPDLTNPIPDIYPVEGNPPQGWGLTFMLSNGGPTGRSKGTGFWAGLPNCWWWCDREKGVGGIASQPQVATAPPPKRRRTSETRKRKGSCQSATTAKPTEDETTNNDGFLSSTTPPELGVTFGDFPCGGSMFAIDPAMTFMDEPVPKFEREETKDLPEQVGLLSEENCTLLDCDSGKGSSLRTLSDISDDKLDDSPRASYEVSNIPYPESTSTEGTVACVNRKRRRRSSSASVSYGAPPYPAISYASNLLSSSNNAYLTESLLRVYHDSFENALACWVTERTCPYSAKSDGLLATNARPDWNRIYHRVIRLDRLASAIRGRRLTQTEDQKASRALDLAVFSFASQWAQSGQRSRTKYPFHSTSTDGNSGVFDGQEDCPAVGVDFDRTLQITAWHEARNALQKAGEVESFRVVLAQIIFALTQKPVETPDRSLDRVAGSVTSEAVESEDGFENAQGASALSMDQDMDECADLMSKLNLAIEADGPPVHLESGLRLIHSLRSRMAVCRDARRGRPEPMQGGRQRRSPTMRLEDADRATVDLLFWLGVMFDTLSAAMHRRPLVVSDEDSDIVLNESIQMDTSAYQETTPASTTESDGLWDEYLFARQQQNLEHAPTRWPCSFDEAATSLCDAAPVKVLLFRRVCRIQTLLTRNARGTKVEEAIAYSTMTVSRRVFSRATLLLADLMEVVDESELGNEDATEQRNSSGFIAKFRENNCRVLSDLASCACPRDDASFQQSREFHFAVNEGALLTEPWTAVLIRAFAKAGVLLLESETLLPSGLDQEDAFRRADDCIKALWFLGRKSDMALSAAKILGDALKQRRKSAQDRHCEESVPIAQLAEEHHQCHGRPLRIAVDEADWRFNNLTVQQVHAIRDGVASNQQAFQGIEKAMFYRICRLLTLKIQLIFVFDGPGRPWKRGQRGQGPIKYEERRLLQEMLKYLGIPYHEAPGEAEAECARMQILGMVDAVWSQDSDCLMFGCTLWLHDHRIAKEKGNTDRSKENTKKNGKYAQVVRARDLHERHGLDREGLVLFAMLVGGDYDVQGLPQCGPSVAMQAVKQGLGKSLCACLSQQDCHVWSAELAIFLQTTSRGRTISVPSTFPDYKTLQKYYHPKITADQDLLSRSRLNLDYERPIQELELLRLTSERFNIWGRLYMNWPLMKTFERKLTFSPFMLTSLCRADFEGPRLGHWNGDTKVLFDKDHRVECEIPEYWLRNALPGDVLDPSQPMPKPPSKRKRTERDTGETTPESSRKRKCRPPEDTPSALSRSPQPHQRSPRRSSPWKSTRANPVDPEIGSKSTSTLEILDLTGLSESDDEHMVRTLSGSRSKGQSAVVSAKSPTMGFDYCRPSDLPSLTAPRSRWEGTAAFDISGQEDEELQLALRLSMQDHQNSQTPAPRRGKYDDIFAMREAGRDVPGWSISAWSGDQMVHRTPGAATFEAPSHHVRSARQDRSNSSRRGVHANAIGADPLEDHPGLLSPKLLNRASNTLPSPAEVNNFVTGPKAPTRTSPNVPPADIRAARLGHFKYCSSASTVPDTKSTRSHSAAVPLGTHRSPAIKIPEDIECVDLTDD
ncbi:beta-lactamase-like protein [Stemphylium lycopersici]|nr:beta-lactamase-like protein [Stemphylium lycopersici]